MPPAQTDYKPGIDFFLPGTGRAPRGLVGQHETVGLLREHPRNNMEKGERAGTSHVSSDAYTICETREQWRTGWLTLDVSGAGLGREGLRLFFFYILLWSFKVIL